MKRTLTEDKLTKLLEYSEADICDFKEQIYHIEDEGSKISFLKDILSMANTIRDESAYIVIGIRQEDGHNEFFDVNTNIDENNFISFIKGNVGPELPEFTYYTMKYKKHIVGVFEIGISRLGPFVSKKNYGYKVKKNQVYYRYGSSNSEADEQKKQEIKNWMKMYKNDNFKLISKQLELENQDKYNYILFIGEDYQFSTNQYKTISRFKWSLIIDYTRKSSDEGGLNNSFQNENVSKHDITPEVTRPPKFYEGKSLFWYLAPNTNKPGSDRIDAREWGKKYFQNVNSCINQVVSSMEKQVIFVSMYTGECKNASVDSLIYANSNTPLFYKHIDISKGQNFYINDNDPEYVEIQCLCDEVCNALSLSKNISVGEDDYKLVQNEGFSVEEPAWIHEEMQPLYVNIEKKVEGGANQNLSFFQGREIRWNELNPCIAAERMKYKELISRVDNSFKSSSSSCDLITIDYEAGAGVTTVMKMIAWHFHDSNPVVMLNHYSKDGTRERLRSLSQNVKRHRILLVVDLHDFDIQLMRELGRNLEVDNTPVTILFSRRHIRGGVQNYLEEQLRGNEISAFESIYNRQIELLNISEENKEDRKKTVDNIRKENPNTITPFLYALCAFEDSFIKLSDYVRTHLENVNEIQKKILILVSSIHYYTGMEVPIVLVQQIVLGEGVRKIEQILSKKQYRLLIKGDEVMRTLHHSVSREMLKQLCAFGMTDERAWKNKLEKALMSVIDVLELFKTNEKSMRILKALFLNQKPSNKSMDTDEQSHFSYAIEDLPDNVAKKNILITLSDKFNINPYVYSNLARYCYYIEEKEDDALKYLQEALNLKEDYTFYHLKGIVLARKMRKYIKENKDKIKENFQTFIRKLNDVSEEVEDVYDKSVEINIENIAAFTSKLNYFLSIIRDVQKHIYPNLTVNQMIRNEKHSWCNNYIAKVSETLENIRIIDLHMKMNHENEIAKYESQLYALIGDISKAINGWDSLLTKEDVFHPTIRRNLIRSYYQQCKKEWSSLEKHKCAYVQKLISDNITEEPDNARNIVQWFDFVRNFKGYLNKTIEYFKQYVTNPDIEYYYRAMLSFFAYGLKNGDKTYIQQGMKFSNICEEQAREKPNRRSLLDVYNPKEEDMKKIEEFKKYRKKSRDYDSALALVPKVRGRIAQIDKPEIGYISLEGLDINIKFNPSRNQERIYRRTNDEGVKVEFVLGFRLEGVFAFSVSDVK